MQYTTAKRLNKAELLKYTSDFLKEVTFPQESNKAIPRINIIIAS